jgi:SAM-dependent methyltransferase
MERPAYSALAEHYDRVMASVDYDAWASYTAALLHERGLAPGAAGPVGDLGCGTGAVGRRLASAGFPVTGIDKSHEMVHAARRGAGRGTWAVGDLCRLPYRDASLGGAICLFDTLNHLLEAPALRSAIGEASRVIAPGGPFVFDLNTRYALRHSWCGPEQLIVNDPDCIVIWEGSMEDADVARLDLTLLAREGDSDRFRRSVEVHRERAWAIPFLRRALARAEFGDVEFLAHLTNHPPGSRTERIMGIARRRGEA